MFNTMSPKENLEEEGITCRLIAFHPKAPKLLDLRQVSWLSALPDGLPILQLADSGQDLSAIIKRITVAGTAPDFSIILTGIPF
jgi:hypothetical protein